MKSDGGAIRIMGKPVEAHKPEKETDYQRAKRKGKKKESANVVKIQKALPTIPKTPPRLEARTPKKESPLRLPEKHPVYTKSGRSYEINKSFVEPNKLRKQEANHKVWTSKDISNEITGISANWATKYDNLKVDINARRKWLTENVRSQPDPIRAKLMDDERFMKNIYARLSPGEKKRVEQLVSISKERMKDPSEVRNFKKLSIAEREQKGLVRRTPSLRKNKTLKIRSYYHGRSNKSK